MGEKWKLTDFIFLGSRSTVDGDCSHEIKPCLLPGRKAMMNLLLLLLSHFSCARLCDPIDGSPQGSPVPGILQARTLEWVAISFSSAWKWKVKVKLLSCIRLLATPWTAAYQASLSMGFSRQEYWSGVPLPSPCLVAQLCPTLCFLWTVARGILKARILEWVAMPSSRGSSQSRDQTRVSHTAGGFFTI